MKIKYYIKKVADLNIPARANPSDAGYDVVATSHPKIVGIQSPDGKHYLSIDYIEYETNLYITPKSSTEFIGSPSETYNERNFHSDFRARSSISKYNLVLANSVGLIDRGYKDQVFLRFKYLWQPSDLLPVHKDVIYGFSPQVTKIYKKGDRIAQLVVSQTHDVDFEVVDKLPGEDRGGGFGSSDKKI